jgi:hypothetical protein
VCFIKIWIFKDNFIFSKYLSTVIHKNAYNYQSFKNDQYEWKVTLKSAVYQEQTAIKCSFLFFYENPLYLLSLCENEYAHIGRQIYQ